MKKYAATLLSVFLVCGCSNITPNNEKVEVSQEKLENMTALYTGLAEANETIDNKSKIGVWAYYEDGTKEFITEGWTVKDPVTLEAGKTSEVTVEYQGLESTIQWSVVKWMKHPLKQSHNRLINRIWRLHILSGMERN